MRFVESKPARIDRIVFTRVYFFARVIKFAGLKPDRDDVIGYRLNPSCHRETFSTREGGRKKEKEEKKIYRTYKIRCSALQLRRTIH